jgi:hypothetical protein
MGRWQREACLSRGLFFMLVQPKDRLAVTGVPDFGNAYHSAFRIATMRLNNRPRPLANPGRAGLDETPKTTKLILVNFCSIGKKRLTTTHGIRACRFRHMRRWRQKMSFLFGRCQVHYHEIPLEESSMGSDSNRVR